LAKNQPATYKTLDRQNQTNYENSTIKQTKT